LTLTLDQTAIPDAVLKIFLFGCLLPVLVNHFRYVDLFDLGFIQPCYLLYNCTIFLLLLYELVFNRFRLLVLKLLSDEWLILNVPFPLLFGNLHLFDRFRKFR
jgi:hypothetical protein